MRFLLLLVLVSTPLCAQDSSARVSEQSAYRTSLLGTVIPVAAGMTIVAVQGSESQDRTGPALLVSTGLLLGPSLGYFSADLAGRGWRGLGLRTGIGVASVMGAMAVCGMSCAPQSDQANGAALVLVGGGVLTVASAAYDIARVKHNVRRHRAPAPASEPAFSLAPTYLPGRSAGVLVHVSF